MAIPFHKTISSIEAIQSSIEHDSQVYHWFLHYLAHPAVQGHIQKSTEQQRQYTALRKLGLSKIILFITLLIITIFVSVTKQYFLFLSGAPMLWGIYKLSCLQRTKVAALSCSMLLENKENNHFEKKTLFQICEIYGKDLNIPTLVDTITRQDAIMRRTLIYACVITCFIYPFDFWNNWLIIFVSLFLIQCIINTPIVFDRLK